MISSYSRTINLPFREVVSKTKQALAAEGFGILSEIDVKATLKAKLQVDFEEYIILGACNPPLAYQALKAEKEIGLMLPCNVVVFVRGGKTIVAAIRPTIAMEKSGNDALKPVAEKVEQKLKKVVDSI